MALCWIVLVAASLNGGLLAPLLSVTPLRWLGTRSYAIYLFHWPLTELTDWHPLQVIGVTLALAEVSYRLVETPIRRGTGRAVPVLVAAALALVAIAGSVAATSTPARAIGQRTEGIATPGFDELPGWAADHLDSTRSADLEEPRAGIPAVPIVTVLGDSAAVHVADGLRRWTGTNRLVAVVDRSITGCSPVANTHSSWREMRGYRDERFREFPPNEPCRRNDIESGSVLVLVADHGTPMHDHRYTDGTWLSILDERLASDIRESYRQLVDLANAYGARVVFTTAPRILPHPKFGSDHPMQDPGRTDAYNRLLRDLVQEFDSVHVGLLDTAEWLDASGRGGPYPRSDGLHIDFAYTEAFAADVVGPALLELLTE